VILKLTDKKGLEIYIDTRSVLLTERISAGEWRITTSALGPAQMGGEARSKTFNAHRYLDLDASGAGPLIKHLEAGKGMP
jgi:hypothetical protein